MSSLDEAIRIVKEGGIVIYPTDTAYGIGCRIDNVKSVEKLFKIRKRPLNQATPVLVSSIRMAEKYFLSPLPDNVRQVMKDYWPGALTVVYKCREDDVPLLVRGGGSTIGLRMPNHGVPLTIIKSIGVPLLGPSANFHGDPTPYDFKSLNKKLLSLADYVIPGKCMGQLVSTVVNVNHVPFKILRRGPVILPRILYIDTSDSKKVVLKLVADGKEFTKEATNNWTSQSLLPSIEKLLSENDIKLSQLTELRVHTGPGSYTGLRVGVAVANTLSYLLKIPVNGKPGQIDGIKY